MIWDDKDPSIFACMEKTKVAVISNDSNSLDSLETCSGYLLRCCGTHLSAIMLDDVMSPSSLKICTFIQRYDCKALALLKRRLEDDGIDKVISFAEKQDQRYIWEVLAKAALNQRQLDIAEKAFVQLQDYVGIRFIKRAQQQVDETRQNAEIAYFLQDFNLAETLFRFDLAINLRLSLNDVHGVLRIVQNSEYDDDDISLYSIWERIGDIYFDRCNWSSALMVSLQFFPNETFFFNCYLQY